MEKKDGLSGELTMDNLDNVYFGRQDPLINTLQESDNLINTLKPACESDKNFIRKYAGKKQAKIIYQCEDNKYNGHYKMVGIEPTDKDFIDRKSIDLTDPNFVTISNNGQKISINRNIASFEELKKFGVKKGEIEIFENGLPCPSNVAVDKIIEAGGHVPTGEDWENLAHPFHNDLAILRDLLDIPVMYKRYGFGAGFMLWGVSIVRIKPVGLDNKRGKHAYGVYFSKSGESNQIILNNKTPRLLYLLKD